MSIVLSSVVLIFIIDGLKLIKKRQWKEFIAFGILLAIALILQIAKDLGLPAPLNVIDKLFRPLGKAILRNN